MLGRLESVTAPDGGVTSYEYDANGRTTRVTDALNGETEYVYDALGRAVEVTDALGATTANSYDIAGVHLKNYIRAIFQLLESKDPGICQNKLADSGRLRQIKNK